MATATTEVDGDITNPAFYADEDPHPLFARLRNERPVFQREDPSGLVHWVLTKHADQSFVYRRPDIFSTQYGVTFDTYRGATPDPAAGAMLEFSAPRHHKELRKEFNKSYNRRAIKVLEPTVRKYAQEKVARAASLGSFDFAREIADPVTSAVVFGLLGFPSSDWDLLFDLSRRSQEETHPSIPGRCPFDTSAAEANHELVKYLMRLLNPRRDDLQDGHVKVLSGLLFDGEPLSQREVILNTLNIMQGGNSTTRHAASGGVLALIQHPDEAARLTSRSHFPLLVEEVVRWTSPAIHFMRRATRDVTVRDARIRKGDAVSVWPIAGNRDEEVFTDPYRFDALRSPNKHIGFIAGPHLCLGINVARLELRVLFEEVLRGLPGLRLNGPVTRVASNFIAGIDHLPVTVS
jgi:cytochrome P450